MLRSGMDKDEIIATLRAHEPELRARGVTHAALFGSRARGDHDETSDIDIMIQVDETMKIGVYGYVGLKRDIGALFRDKVDVVVRDQLKPYARGTAEANAIDAF